MKQAVWRGLWAGLLLWAMLAWVRFPNALTDDVVASWQAPAWRADAVCKVQTVFDGDTFACDVNQDGTISGKQDEVRLLGIDTPEMHYSKKNHTGQDEPGAQAASAYTTSQLHGKTVYLEFDERRQDKYGRTLAYVFLDKQGQRMINRDLLQLGLATVLFIPPNLKYQDQFDRLSKKARL